MTPGELWVERPGLQTTVQDLGRRARQLGVPGGGAADPTALRLANALVGNLPYAAALELTLHGPRLVFREAVRVALCGAPFAARLDGSPFPLWRPVDVAAGAVLDIGGCDRGARAVLAVRGGLLGQIAFGSRSTALGAGFGGLGGRALQAGDVLNWQQAAPLPWLPLWVGESLRTPLGPQHVLRVIATAEARKRQTAVLTRQSWTVSHQANRVGVRLDGVALPAHDPGRVSLPTGPGLVQCPPDGRLILLLPDAGTHGGYPAPWVVVRADLARLGQLRPGDTVRFREVTVEQARLAWQQQELVLRRAEGALAARWRLLAAQSAG